MNEIIFLNNYLQNHILMKTLETNLINFKLSWQEDYGYKADCCRRKTKYLSAHFNHS